MRRCAALLALAILGCRGGDEASVAAEPSAEQAPEPSSLIAVSAELLRSGRLHLAAAERRAPDDELVAPARVAAAPEGEAQVSAALAGRVIAIHAREGDRVERGQPLATLAAPDVARLQGEVAAARARRKAAQRIVDQERNLADQRATSERALLTAQSDLAEAQAAERVAAGQLAAYRGAGDEIRSPIAGVIAHRQIALGQQVAPGQLVFHVVAPEHLEIHAAIPLGALAGIEKGTAVSLFPLGLGASCTGKVAATGAAVEPGSTRVVVRVAPAADCPPLLVGAYVEARLRVGGKGEPMLAVPRSAVLELDGVPVVFTPAESATETTLRFKVVPVDVHRLTPRWAYLSGGVEPGTEVVDRGAILLKGEHMRGALE